MASTETFSTGANRNDSSEQIDPEGFLSPEVLQVYFDYMHKNRYRPNGEFRDSDNWQLGIPQYRYMKSLWRHFFAACKLHRKLKNNLREPNPYRNQQILEDCCGILFNTFGYMFEELKKPLKENTGPGIDRPHFITGMTVQPDFRSALNRRVGLESRGEPYRSQLKEDLSHEEADADSNDHWGV